MKRTIRQGVFETNSSSVHSLTMCSDDEWQKWKDGDLIYNRWNEEFTTYEEYEKARREFDEENKDYYSTNEEFEEYRESSESKTVDGQYYSYEDFFEGYIDYDTFSDRYTTPNGEVVHAFGYYGHD